MTSKRKPSAASTAARANGNTCTAQSSAERNSKQAINLEANNNGLTDLYEVANRPIFVPYKLVPKANGKTDKVPSNGQHSLSYTCPGDLMPMVEALALVNEWRGLHGVGLVFEGGIIHDGWQLIGLDYDGVDFDLFQPPVATYAERSPSGKGIHQYAWVPVAWAAQRAYTGGIQLEHCHHGEVYVASRFLTASGDKLNDLPIIRLDAEALAVLETWDLNPFVEATAPMAAAPDIEEGTAFDWTCLGLTENQRHLVEGTGDIDRSDVLYGLIIKAGDAGRSKEDTLASMVRTDPIWAMCLDHREGNEDKALRYAMAQIDAAYPESLAGKREVLNGFNEARRPGVSEPRADEPNKSTPFPRPFPGPMADAVAAGLDVAHKPQEALTVMAVLSAMAAACGSFYQQQNGSRLNLYFLGIAKTGTGKDLPLRLAKQMARLGNAKVIGAPGSGQGLEDALQSNVATYCAVDEIAHFFSAMNDTRASSYERGNARKLLELFSASSDAYETRPLAGKEARIIQCPALNLIGFTTPEKLGTAFNPDDFADGLAGRILFVFTDNNPPARRVRKSMELPGSFKQTAKQVEQGLFRVLVDGGIVIGITEDAEHALDLLLAEFDERGRVVGSSYEAALCVRSLEKVERIAGVLAVWDNHGEPVITTAHIDWAAEFVRASNAAVLSFVDAHMHGGIEQENAAMLLAMIRDGTTTSKRKGEMAALKAGWLPRSALMRRAKTMDVQSFDRALRNLQERGEIVVGPFENTKLQVIGLSGDD
ncbi:MULTISPECIES: DUF3987 domain-containing protein [unclassified Pseudomonas]|uniref:DUF3987 domain-containing protein n=1 Tax=unclassified Pseudomonas TaxID=196821 RepID=UPI003FA1A4D6